MLTIDKEFQELIPPLADSDYEALKESIIANGCREPISIWGDIIVDGHNRYAICTENNIPYKTKQVEFTSRNEAKLWMIDVQLSRRNMEMADKILLAQQKKPLLEQMAKERLEWAGKTHGRGMTEEIGFIQMDKGYSEDDEINAQMEELLAEAEAKLPEKRQKINVQKEIARLAGCGSGTVARFEQVQKEKPELINDIRNHKMSINEAYNEVTRKKKEEKRDCKVKENTEKVKQLSSPLEAQGLFQTIVIDPPWDWGDEGDVNQFGRAKPDYHTMPIEEIKALPVNEIADENCHLYLWVTNRSLPKAFSLIEAWGFRYITCLTWVKPSIGMGNYFRGSTEQILFAVKGSLPLKRKDVGTFFEAPRGQGHSAKPDEFYSLVESCSYAPYIDIFGRKDRDGWSVWGENT